LYAFGKRCPPDWNICVSADFPTAGSPIIKTFGLAVTIAVIDMSM